MRALLWPFSFQGRVSRLTFALLAPLVFFSQHLATALAVHAWTGRWPAFDLASALAPLRLLALTEPHPEIAMVASILALVAVNWLLASLAFRCAAGFRTSLWAAAFIITPGLQILAYFAVCFERTRRDDLLPSRTPPETARDTAAIVRGLLAGIGVTTAAVVFGALVLHRYGYAMFIATPLMVGAITGYLANRRQDIGAGATIKLGFWALLLGALTLLGVAVEGFICILMAAPIEMAMVAIGALIGHGAARAAHRPRQAMMSAPILPLIFLSELLISPVTPLRTVDRIDIAAPPAAVWSVLSRDDRIAEQPALPFRLGLAYPMGSRFEGQGVGAIRRGEFSTGEALEKVTVWRPGRELAFAVLTDPPSLRELSPYKIVHAPHAVGFFRTTGTSFQLEPLANGGTRLTLVGQHSLKLDPLIYWAPIADVIIKANTGRVLRHIKACAEAGKDSVSPA